MCLVFGNILSGVRVEITLLVKFLLVLSTRTWLNLVLGLDWGCFGFGFGIVLGSMLA